MNLAVVGCGYISGSYGKTLGNYPQLTLVGAYDRDASRLRIFRDRWGGRAYDSLEQVLGDPAVEMVLNLTNPREHYDITKRCIEAGKHVYSEKPLAMEAARARELVVLARQKNVAIASAPCSMLSETAQTLWKAVRGNVIGRVRLVYANFDDGMIAPRQSPRQWQNESGLYWPAKDEFEVGCTYEHAGYVLTWLAALFGPALRMTSFASCQIPDKGIPVASMAPDFAVGCIEYGGGVVARVTCSLVAPHDKSLTVIGDDGVLAVANVRNDSGAVKLRRIPSRRWQARIERRINTVRRRLKFPGAESEWHMWEKYPLVGQTHGRVASPDKPVDFSRGPAELANAIVEKRPCRLSPELGWHIAELVERLQYPERFCSRDVESRFAPIEPLYA